MVELNWVGNNSEKFLIGLKSFGDKAGLLLDFSKVIEVLSFGWFERNCLSKIIEGVLGITLFGKEGGEVAGDFG